MSLGPNITTAVDNEASSVICYKGSAVTGNMLWRGRNDASDYALPIFIMQIVFIVIFTRILVFLLKPLHQPRVIAEIIGGILLGPSVLGQYKWFCDTVFPKRSTMVLETMANLGLLYFLFLVGVEMDLNVVKRTSKKAFVIAVCGMAVPFIMGAYFASILKEEDGKGKLADTKVATASYVLFLGVSVSVTAFPVLARILAELKLLNTELGRLAMSSALINDVFAWVLLAVAIAMSEKDAPAFTSIGVIVSSVGFVFVCVFLVRPAILWVIRHTPEGENFSELYLTLILSGVMLSGFITDVIGTHAILGGFVYGLVIPNGPLGAQLIEKLEDFVTGLLLPLFFAITGLRTNFIKIKTSRNWLLLLIINVLACVAKLVTTLLLAIYYQMPLHEGFVLGLLMNTKGLIEIIVLNLGRDQKVLNDSSFAIMVLVSVVMTCFITPMVMLVYIPGKRFVPYKRRTIQRSKLDLELRILACIHTPRNVPTIINLLEASHPTRKSPIFVYVLHLVELTGRASAMLIVHNSHMASGTAANRTQAQSDHIINEFQDYVKHAGGVSVQPLTAISPYPTMHEDICNIAEDKCAAFIIIPFHKQQSVDGGMEVTNPAYRTVNQNVLANAPCSVGILVDRGLTGSAKVAATHIAHHVVVLFFGGPDDREALAYASRMADHPDINLTVIRFLPGEEAVQRMLHQNNSTRSQSVLTVVTDNDKDRQDNVLTIATDNDKERQMDDDFIHAFRLKTVNKESIIYTERVVNNGEETIGEIRSIDSIHDLYIIGRGTGITPLTAGLTDFWSECPELGVIGDILASTDFSATVSVLVVQQYVGVGLQEGIVTPDIPGQQNEFCDDSIHNRRASPRPQRNGAQCMFRRAVNNDYVNSWSP